MFTSDLNRCPKDAPHDVYVEDTKDNYVCYQNTCTNNTKLKNRVKNGRPFKNLQDCKSSGCESLKYENSGISAINYSKK